MAIVEASGASREGGDYLQLLFHKRTTLTDLFTHHTDDALGLHRLPRHAKKARNHSGEGELPNLQI